VCYEERAFSSIAIDGDAATVVGVDKSVFTYIQQQCHTTQPLIRAYIRAFFASKKRDVQSFLRLHQLAEKAQEIEVTIPVKKRQEARYNLDPGSS